MNKTLLWIDYWLQDLWKRIRQATYIPEKSSYIYRIVFGLFLLLIGTPEFSWIENIPDAFFDPPVLSFAALFNEFPDAPFFFFCEVILLLLTVNITLGIKARWSSLLYVLIIIVCFSFKYSLGKIDHPILLYLTLICFAFSNWGCYNAIWKDKKVSSPHIGPALAGVFLSYGMLTAGLPKLIGWVDFDLRTSGFLNWFYSGYFLFERDDLLMSHVFSFSPLFTEFLDYSAVIFELSPFFFLIKGRKSWRFWLLIAGFFHLGNTLFLNINFINHFIIYIAYFLVFQGTILSKKKMCFLIVLVFSLIIMILGNRIMEYFSLSFNIYNDLYFGYNKLYISLLIWLFYILIVVDFLRKRSRFLYY